MFHILAQKSDHLCFSVCIRGMLFSRPRALPLIQGQRVQTALTSSVMNRQPNQISISSCSQAADILITVSHGIACFCRKLQVTQLWSFHKNHVWFLMLLILEWFFNIHHTQHRPSACSDQTNRFHSATLYPISSPKSENLLKIYPKKYYLWNNFHSEIRKCFC